MRTADIQNIYAELIRGPKVKTEGQFIKSDLKGYLSLLANFLSTWATLTTSKVLASVFRNKSFRVKSVKPV